MLYLNGQPVPVTIFPDKTSQVWKLPQEFFAQSKTTAHVLWTFEHEGEFMHLAQLTELTDRCRLGPRFSSTTLELKYLPYGRQDKVVANSTTFALRTFAKLVNGLGFMKVIIHDPHSEVALELIANSSAVYPTQQLANVLNETGATIVCYPDKGAVAKYTKVYKELVGSAHMYGEKVRDQLTGNITSYKIVGNPHAERVLIVDDICDGGMTFKLLAKDLLAAGAESIVLFVTHGIFSKGLQTLKDSGIQRIYTQDGEAVEDWIDGHSGIKQITYRRL